LQGFSFDVHKEKEEIKKERKENNTHTKKENR
jgi:hypothetical protein